MRIMQRALKPGSAAETRKMYKRYAVGNNGGREADVAYAAVLYRSTSIPSFLPG